MATDLVILVYKKPASHADKKFTPKLPGSFLFCG